ncbi:Ig-like domain-containing protein [Comamonas thiooxydans]|uniref:Ig-like domain-containing protein n=1 Tax=Comamonas thiooxydans TaxID=363952 RepID=UPI0006986B36|nr:Ig-like domain-containing protein [Comamonas thiooxydans]
MIRKSRSFWSRLTQAMTTQAVKTDAPQRLQPASAVRPLALEQRFMFDGAAAVDVAHAATDAAAPAAAEHMVDTATALRHALTSEAQRATEASPATTQRQEVVFVDSNIKDYEQLISGLKPGTEVVVLDANKDGLQQIADYLDGRSGIDSIHVLSHGKVGQVQLGSDWLDSADLASRSELLNAIGQSMASDGDILLYGCQVGANGEGRAFIDGLSAATGADVAASNDLTGAASMGGDWVLEVNQGTIESRVVDGVASYSGLLVAADENYDDDANQSFSTSVFTLDGVKYTITGAGGANYSSLVSRDPLASPLGDGGSDYFLLLDSAGLFGVTSIKVEMADGSMFRLNGLSFDGLADTNILITPNGGSALSFISNSSFITHENINTSGNTDFQNISSFTISGGNISIALDDLNFEAPQVIPTLTSATVADPSLKAGETSLVTFTFNTAVSGFTTADLTVDHGVITGLSSSNGGLTWTGTLTPDADVTDTSNLVTVNLAGVTSVSSSTAGSGAASSNNYAIDTHLPTVTSVSSSTSNGTYAPGAVISITVTFDEVVTVTGVPQLTLETGSTDRVVSYASGSGTNTLTFNYTVQAGDTSADLDYVSSSALSLNGGTIRDAATNNATLTLASPGAAGSLGANKAIVIDSSPSFSNLNGDSVAWAGVGGTVTLDVSGNATLADAEFGALNGGNGNWAGASLTVQRPGTAVSADIFGFNTSGALFTVSGNALQSGGLTFATFTNTGGVLTIAFTSSGTAATTALINDVAHRVTYRSDTPAGDATVRFTLSDGPSSATADTTVTSDTIYITNTSDTATINVSDGVSFSEAVAIAAADATGSQTLVFSSNFNSAVSLAGSLSINESLTLNADSASGLIISGGNTITLGGGTTLNFTNSTGTVTIAATLGGSGALSKAGAGTLVLSSVSNEANMSGGITVTGGTLQVQSDDHLSSGTLTLNGGTLTNGTSAFTIDNAIALGASGGTFNIGGGSGAAQVTLSGVVSGSGSLIKNGQAILELSGNNTYTGATNVTAGTVIASHANALGTTAGATTVASGATVRLAGALTVAESFSIAGTGKAVSAVNYGALHLNSGSTTVSGTVTLTAAADISAASGSTLTLAGALNGAFSLNKTDAGTLALSNSGNEAGLTAGTSITAGTLSIANDDYLSSGTITLNGGTLAITGATTIDNAIALASAAVISTSANATLSGVLSGSGTLTKSGASTLTLSGSNTHSGAVNLSAGGLTLSGGSAIGNSSAVTLSGGTTLTLFNAETIGSLAGTGSVVLNAGLTTGGDNTSTTYSGVISGTSGLTKSGSGTLTLTGNNTYTGATNVSAGGLTLNRVGGALDDNTSVAVASGATLTVAAGETIDALSGAGTVALGTSALTIGINGTSSTFSGAITGSGTLTLDGGGTFTLSGTNSGQSWGMQVLSGGTVSIAGDANLGSGTLQLNDGTLSVTSAGTIDNAISLGASAGSISVGSGLAVSLSSAIGGTGALTKTGSGALTLSGSNNYAGTTTVSAGTLSVAGSTASATTVAAGGTLAGTGILGGNVTVQSSGLLSPGNAGAGSLTINGNLQMNAGSVLAVEINGTTAGTQYDQVVVNGAVIVAGATLSATHGYTPGLGDVYTIISNNLADAVTGSFSGLAEGGTLTAGGNSIQLTANYAAGDGNDFTLTAPINSMPVVTGLDGDSTPYTAGTTVVLDAGGNAVVSDAEDDLANWSGASLVVQRYTGGSADPSANDLFGFDLSNANFSVSGNAFSGDLQFAGLTFATYNYAGGVLTITFTGSSFPASTALVQDVVRHISYNNATPYGDANIRFALTDSLGGTVNSDVTLTCNTIYVDQSNDDAGGDAADGFSLREALARGAAQGGADTIRVVLADNSTITLGSGVTGGAGDTLDLDGANGLTIGGSTITLGGGFTISNGFTDTATIASTLAGSGSLTKTGAGTLTLASTGNEAGFSGAIAIDGGTLAVGTGDALGSGELQFNGGTFDVTTGGVTVDNNMVFGAGGGSLHADVDWTASGVFSGGGTLSKTGIFGTLALSGTSQHTGTTVLGEGILAVGSDSNLGSGLVSVYGGTFSVTSNGQTIDNAFDITSRSGAIELGFGIEATLSGLITGSGDFFKSGSGTLNLINIGNSASNWTFGQINGTTVVTSADQIGGGILKLAGGTLAVNSNSTFTLNRTTQVLSAVTLDATGSGTGVVISLGGLTSGSGAFNLNAGDSQIYLSNASGLSGNLTLSSSGGTGLVAAIGNSTLGSGTINLTAGATLGVAGSGRTFSNDIVLLGDATLRTGSPATGDDDITFSGVISESGGARNLTVNAYSVGGNHTDVVLAGNNTYTGTTTLVAGTLSVASDANLGGGDLILAGGTLAVGGATTIDNNVIMSGGATIQADAATTLSGVISGGGTLTKSGSATLTLTGAETHTGATTVSAGTLAVNGSTASATTVSNGGTLAGTGALGAVTVLSGGTLAPGGNAAGILTINGPLSMAAGSTLALQINGLTAGSGYDQVVVNGTVDMSAANLAVTHGYASAEGDAYTIISNDLADSVTGTFSGLAEGGIMAATGNGTALTTSYIGGNGNDVTLTAPIFPRVTGVTSSNGNGQYGIGDVITITVTFDANVSVTGTPQLLLETGATDRPLNYVSGSGSNTLTFSYTVQAGDVAVDLDYAATTALTLNGGTIKGAASQDAILTLAAPGAAGSLGANKALVVDGVRPSASISLSDSSLTAGETATVTITFSEAVTGFSLADLTARYGTLSNLSTSDNIHWTATLTPDAGNTSNGNYVSLDNSLYTDASGNTGAGVALSSLYAVDTQRPTATIVVSNNSLNIGGSSLVTITFSEAVTNFGLADMWATNGTLSNLSTSDNITWTATLTPTNGVTHSGNVVTLSNFEVNDLVGNAGTGTTNSNTYSVDTQRPTATIVFAKPNMGIGQMSLVTITFSEAVSDFTNDDLTVSNGTLSAVSSSDGGVTWTATFTPTAGINSASNYVILDNTGVLDGAGNVGSGTTTSNNYGIDGVRPTATVAIDKSSLIIGQTAQVTITFSEAVTSFSNSDLTVSNGTLSAVSSSDGGVTWTATFTPAGNITSASNVITLGNTGYTDTAGNAGTGTSVSSNYAIDTQRPTATIVMSDPNLSAGETSQVTITFSEAVTGFTLGELNAGNGTLSNLSSSDGGVTWTATFTPNANTSSGTNVITLANTGIFDIAGNSGAGTTSSVNYSIDTVRPTATIVVANPALKIGDTSQVTITFSQAVSGFTNADLTVVGGTLSAVSSADGGVTWTATFTPAGDISNAANLITLDNSGVNAASSGNTGTGLTTSNNYVIDTQRPTATIVVAKDQLGIGGSSQVTIIFSEAVTGFSLADLTAGNGTLSNLTTSDNITWTATLTPAVGVNAGNNHVSLDNTGVTDIAGNAGSGTTDSNAYAVDSIRPTATIVINDPTLSAGESTTVTITFSEAVTGLDNNDLSVPNGTLGTLSSSDGGITWTATYTPNLNVRDTSNVIVLNNTGYTDLAGNAGVSVTNSANFTIDTVRPTATIVVANPALNVGATSLVTITFSEAVSGFTNADLVVSNGTLSAVSSSDGGVTWTATFTPSVNIADTTNVITLDNSGVQNASGNAGSGATTSNNYSIDTLRPTATITVANPNLGVGQATMVTIAFSEVVSGFSLADLSVANGVLSNLASSDGGKTWTATLTPTAAITDQANLIVFDTALVSDNAGNAGVGIAISNNYAVDTLRPTATIVVADAALQAGETTTVTITFSEAVNDFTNTDLSVSGGTLSPVTSSDGGITWTATFTPTANLESTVNRITLSNAGVTDKAGNAGVGTTDSNNYAVDTLRPTATIVVADAALQAGESTLVTITFSEAVTGLDVGDFTVANGSLSNLMSSDGGLTWTASVTPTAGITDATNMIGLNNASYTDLAGNTGSGTTDSNNFAIDTLRPTATIVVADAALTVGETTMVTITFSEAVNDFTNADLSVSGGTLSTVTSSDGGVTWIATFTPAANLESTVNRITLNNTGVTDKAGNAGVGTSDSNNYAIDTLRPTATIVVADNNLRIGETSLVTITFSEAVTGFTNADLTVANGTLSNVSSSDGGVTWTATFTPTSNITDASNLITLDNSGVTDAAGNAGSGTTDSNNYAIDTQRPRANIVVNDAALAVGESSTVIITFSEAVTGLDIGDFTVANGSLSNLSSSDGVTWTATLTPTASITDASNVITLNNTGYMDAAGNSGIGTAISNSYAIDTLDPVAPEITLDQATLVNGRQVSPTGLVFISGLETGGSWQYSLDNGVSWLEGRGNSLQLPGLGAFSLWVQQRDVAGNASSVTSLSGVVEPLVPPAVHAPFAFAVSNSSDGLGLAPFQPSEVPEPNADFLHPASMMLGSVSRDTGMPRQDSWSEYGLPQSIAGVNDWMWASLFAPAEPNRSGFDPAPEQFSVTTGASILDLKPVLLASESPWDIESLQFSLSGKQELPGWVRLDRQSGQLTINAPKDLSATLVLQIKVSDGKGHESVRTVKVVIGDARATSSAPAGRAGLSEKMANAANQQVGKRMSMYVHG